MCGIAGIIRLDGGRVDVSVLDVMTDALSHRGPNGRGTYVDGVVGLGHRRLSVVDLSDASSQPMHSEDGRYTLIFNGEIHNFQEKRSMLEARGHRFRSTGDVEVLLKLYQEFGSRCTDHLRGQFAFAIYDREKRTVFLARDRLGKKPIKYFESGGSFVFASEIKALRKHPECPRSIDEQAIYDYLTMMYIASPRTGFEGIRRLPAAHTMTIDLARGTKEQQRYWQLTYRSDRTKSIEEWKREILDMLRESVRLRMIADVPVGSFLSGGIDSAAVTAFMAKESTQPIETFSIGSDEDSHNELPDAERIAALLSTNHHPIVLKPDIVHLLPELVHTYEEPFADPSSIPTYLLARETRSSVTVALNGDGGDENFAGYIRYPILRFSERYAALPHLFHALMRGGTGLFASLFRTTLAYRSHRFQSSITQTWPERYLQYLSFFTEEEKQNIFHKKFERTDKRYAAMTADARERGDNLIHCAMSMDLDTYLTDDLLPKVDLGTMAHALEARSPLLDHMLLELTAQIPAELKFRGREKKWIFREALRGILPDETLDRKKSGFRLPLDAWFRTDLRSYVTDRLHAADSPLWRLMKREEVSVFLGQYYASSVDFSDHVWSLLWLDEWMRQYT